MIVGSYFDVSLEYRRCGWCGAVNSKANMHLVNTAMMGRCCKCNEESTWSLYLDGTLVSTTELELEKLPYDPQIIRRRRMEILQIEIRWSIEEW